VLVEIVRNNNGNSFVTSAANTEDATSAEDLKVCLLGIYCYWKMLYNWLCFLTPFCTRPKIPCPSQGGSMSLHWRRKLVKKSL
jgi:hypothetical protein